MTRHPERDRAHKVRQVIGYATVGMLAVGAIIFGANRRGDTDAAVRDALRPTTVKMAGKIIKFAEDHPKYSHTLADGRYVTVNVLAGRGRDEAQLSVVTRRQDGSKAPDPEAAVSVAMTRSGAVRGDESQTYNQALHLDLDPIPGADERTVVRGSDGASRFGLDVETAHNTLTAADRIAGDAPSMLGQIETDIESFANPAAHRLMP